MATKRLAKRSMRRLFGRSAALAIAVMTSAAWNGNADTAVILGAGNVGTWTTTGYVTNPNATMETLTVATILMPPVFPQTGPLMLPPNASASLTPFLGGDFTTLYVTQLESSPAAFPIVRARLTSSTSFDRSVDIPVVTLSRLMTANLSTLNFGGITSEPPPPCAIGIPCFAPHSALVLGNIERSDTAPAEDLPVLLELFDPNGNRVGSASLTVPYGQTMLIGDVAAYVGTQNLIGDLGLLRVTRVSGNALMWGIVYTISFGGSVTASAGVNVAP